MADGEFALLGKADSRALAALLGPFVKSPTATSAPDLISFGEALQRSGLARKTLYEWKRTHKLGCEHGLRMVGPRSPLIHWPRSTRVLRKIGPSLCSMRW
jgi:hypothetical protein